MKINVDTGKLDKRIYIQKKVIVSDKSKNQIATWVDYYSCWSAVNGLSGREYWQAREQHEENTINFKVRYCKLLDAVNTTDYRLIFDKKVYDIISIDNVFFADSLINLKAVGKNE